MRDYAYPTLIPRQNRANLAKYLNSILKYIRLPSRVAGRDVLSGVVGIRGQATTGKQMGEAATGKRETTDFGGDS